jgi:hypothetical protein
MMSKNLKGLLLVLALLGINIAIAQQTSMAIVLSDAINGYQAADAIRIDSLDDGTVKVARYYTGGETSLEIRISQLPSGALEELKKQVSRLTTLFEEMAKEGKVEEITVMSGTAQGILTFSDATAGGILLIKNKFLLEYKVTGATSVQNAKSVFESLDFSIL